MQYKFEIKPKLEKKLKKIEKKDPMMFKAVRDKIKSGEYSGGCESAYEIV